MDAAQVDFHVTPFRAERFLERYRPAIARVLAYGASGYLFYRSEEDPHHFVHISFWDEQSAFDRYWFSAEMRETRRTIAGLHEQPLLPHWNAVVEQG